MGDTLKIMQETSKSNPRPLRKYAYTWIAVVLIFLAISSIVIPYLLVAQNTRYVIKNKDAQSQNHVKTGIVLGSLVTKDGKPYYQLQSRLNVAAEALQQGRVDQLILSGNKRSGYDEPAAMQRYLIQVKHIDPDKLRLDNAGHSTYETCERAAKVFNIRRTVLFSAESHLPRAIYLCRHFGIDTIGVAGKLQSTDNGNRELLARTKAVFNVYIYGERTSLEPAAIIP